MIENLTEVINFDQTKQDELNRRMNLTTNYILQELTIETQNESISGTKVYDKWLETFIPKVW